MADLPYMMMNWGRFFADSKVAMLTTEAQGVYALLLGRMWLNEGWLSADDKVLARVLGLDVRRWKTIFKPVIEPLLRREIVAHVGPIYTQKHLQEVRASSLAMLERRFESTARARAAKAAKHGRSPSAPERKRPPATASVTEPVAASAAGPETTSKEQTQSKKEREERNVGDYRGPSPPRANSKQDMVDHLKASLMRALQEEEEQAHGHDIDHDRNEPKLLAHRDEGRKSGDAGASLDLSAIANAYRSGNG